MPEQTATVTAAVPATLMQWRAAAMLGHVYHYIDGSRELPLGEWAIPPVSGPEKGLSGKTPFLRAAIRSTYGLDYHNAWERYRRDYFAVVPTVLERSREFAQESLRAEAFALGALRLKLANQPGLSEQLHDAAQDFVRRAGSLGPSEGDLRAAYVRRMVARKIAPATYQLPEDPRDDEAFKAYGRLLDFEEQRQLAAEADSITRTRIARAIQETTGEVGELLLTLYMHPRGVRTITVYSESAADGTQLALSQVDEAIEALTAFQTDVTQRGKEKDVLGYPLFVIGGLAKLGLNEVPRFKEYAVSIGRLEASRGDLSGLLDFAGAAVFCLGVVFAGPLGVLVLAAADLALAGLGTGMAYVRERQHELAAGASVYRPAGERIAEHAGYGETILAGAAGLLSALAFFKAARELDELLKHQPNGLDDVLHARSHAGAPERNPPAVDRTATGGREIGEKGTDAPMLDNRLTASEAPTARESSSTAAEAGAAPKPVVDPAARDVARPGRSEQGLPQKAGGAPVRADESGLPAKPPADAPASAAKGNITIPGTEEVEKAKAELKAQLKDLEAKHTRGAPFETPQFSSLYLTRQQELTFARLSDSLLTSGERAVPAGLSAERTALIRKAEADADGLRRRLTAHWNASLPDPSRSARDLAGDVLQDVRANTPATKANRKIRDRFFDEWRDTFYERLASDEALLVDLEVQAGVVFNPKPGRGKNRLGLVARDEAGNIAWVNLDLDHTVIRHEDAVLRALRTNDANQLMSTIAASNLEIMPGRENRRVIEMLRSIDRQYWSVVAGPSPRAIQPIP
jgi:hypothetical protein